MAGSRRKRCPEGRQGSHHVGWNWNPDYLYFSFFYLCLAPDFFFASKERFILIAHNRITIMGNSLLNTTRKAIAPHCTMVQSADTGQLQLTTIPDSSCDSFDAAFRLARWQCTSHTLAVYRTKCNWNFFQDEWKEDTIGNFFLGFSKLRIKRPQIKSV